MLATIVEKNPANPSAKFCAKEFRAAQNVSHPRLRIRKKFSHQRAYGYTNDAGVWLETDQSPTSATLGDGGIYTSVDDLTKWDDALRNHTLLSAEEMQPAITPVSAARLAKVRNSEDGNISEYGFGWYLNPTKAANVCGTAAARWVSAP